MDKQSKNGDLKNGFPEENLVANDALALNCTAPNTTKAIFITARVGSSRLPRKHLKKIKNKYCIEHMIERVRKSEKTDKIILCTTTLPEDDILCDLAKKHCIGFFRGSVKDKIERWYYAAQRNCIDFFVTADADDLFCDPELIDLAFDQYDKNNEDLITWDQENLICGAFTYGIKTEALKKVYDMKDTDDTEMMWIFFDPRLFKIGKLESVPAVFNRPEIRATLDYEEDFQFFEEVYKHFDNDKFSLRDVIKVLDKFPHIIEINRSRHADWKNNQEKKIKQVNHERFVKVPRK